MDLENVEEGQLVDCPQCKAPFEIPRRKPEKKAVIIPPPPPKTAKPPKPPYPEWAVAMNCFAGLCVFLAGVSLLTSKFGEVTSYLGSAIACALSAFLIKVLCDIRWHLERMGK